MTSLRWLGLHCIFLGLLACSSTLENPAGQQSAAPPEPVSYVGLKIPPMPDGHETDLGYLLGPEVQGKYAIVVVDFESKKIVWMGRLLYHDEQGRAHWEIIAALPAQSLPTGYRFSGGNCLIHDTPQPEIVAILKMDDQKTLTRAHKAWKADPQKAAFEPLSLEGIQCINERSNH